MPVIDDASSISFTRRLWALTSAVWPPFDLAWQPPTALGWNVRISIFWLLSVPQALFSSLWYDFKFQLKLGTSYTHSLPKGPEASALLLWLSDSCKVLGCVLFFMVCWVWVGSTLLLS